MTWLIFVRVRLLSGISGDVHILVVGRFGVELNVNGIVANLLPSHDASASMLVQADQISELENG